MGKIYIRKKNMYMLQKYLYATKIYMATNIHINSIFKNCFFEKTNSMKYENGVFFYAIMFIN